MKQLLILSGKGGTGKTTITSAFIELSNARAYADCDVDAPNLHLITHQTSKPKTTDYYGLPKAEIDQQLCTNCDLCYQNCRFEAITFDNGYKVDPFACEGCGVCIYVCPMKAISLTPTIDGKLELYSNNVTSFSTAELKMGSGTSGKLVTKVKKQLKSSAGNSKLAIIDGSPGIGCPVIASISGVDMVLIVAEPSVSGISDLERIIKASEKFVVKIAVCVNKFNINIENTEMIKFFCKRLGIPYIGEIPFDAKAIKAINSGQTIVNVSCPAGQAVRDIYQKTIEILFKDEVDVGKTFT